jgi:PIN domain nuclease of toxin-antitoxin system
VYEWTFKAAIGKLGTPPDIAAELSRAGFTPLPLTARHARVAGSLPLHHRDPFDRMLVAQAQVEGLTIVTNDRKIADYQVALLQA